MPEEIWIVLNTTGEIIFEPLTIEVALEWIDRMYLKIVSIIDDGTDLQYMVIPA